MKTSVSPQVRLLLVLCTMTIGLTGCGNFRASQSVPSETSSSKSPADHLKNIAFQMGITHIDGRYRFTDQNFLEEGAQKTLELGAKEIFVYLERNFRTRYPEIGGTKWDSDEIKSLKDLVRSQPFENLFALPFNTYLLTAFSFGMGDQPFRDQHANQDALLKQEETEFYELTKYLLHAYKGSKKTFVLKNWEGDWWGLRSYDPSRSISAPDAEDMIRFFSARQRGIQKARDESDATEVWVLQAVEINRVGDLLNNPNLGRIVNRVIPFINPAPDMIAYSIYDTLFQSGSQNDIHNRLNSAVQHLLNNTPDPLGLGSKRLILSEVGIPENDGYSVSEMEKRLNVVLSIGKNSNLHSASIWELFDNECFYRGTKNLIQTEVAMPITDSRRPRNSDCRGFYLVKPDGTQPTSNRVLKSHWTQIQNQLPVIEPDFRPIPEPIKEITRTDFHWKNTSFNCSSDCSCVQIELANFSQANWIEAHAREANANWDLIGQVDETSFENGNLTIQLRGALRDKIMTTGLRFTIVDKGVEGTWDTTAELRCSMP